MKPMNPRRLRNIKARVKLVAPRPAGLNGRDEVLAETGHKILTVHFRGGGLFWLNAVDDVEALIKYSEGLKKRLDRAERKLRKIATRCKKCLYYHLAGPCCSHTRGAGLCQGCVPVGDLS